MARDKKNLSPFMLWFEEAWEGWIRPLGLILLLGIGVLLYKFDLLGEQSAGTLLVVGIVFGSVLLTGVLPAWPLARAPWQKAMLLTLAVTALVATGYPTLHAALPGGVLAEATLTAEKPTGMLNTGRTGPYDLTVAGHFKDVGRSEAEIGYSLEAKDNSGGSDKVEGTINRKQVVIRSRKGSSSSMQERNEITHRLPDVRGAQVSINGEGSSFDQLADGLKVELRRGSPPPIVFMVLGALALLMCLILDARLVEPKSKVKSYLTASVAIAYAFSIAYPGEATPHALVRPAISSFLLALFLGGLAGWAAGGVVRALFGPKLKKTAAAPRR
jgi:hypothetical protein